MNPDWEPLFVRFLFVVSLFLGIDAIHFDLSSTPLSSHGHQSRRNMGTEYYSAHHQQQHSGSGGEHRVTNVTTQIGTHAFLPCKARQLANKSVSWIRVRDDHILTVDRLTFIADDRYQAFYAETTGLWMLQIKYVQARDAGLYECQVATEQKVSARVHLHVVVPRTELIGEPNRYVKAGSRVAVRCVIRGALEPPSYVMWHFGEEQIFPDNHFGWEMRTDEGESHSTIASLIIPAAKKGDSGNFTCSPSNSEPVSVLLHVINDENNSVMAVTSASIHRNCSYFIAILLVVLLQAS